ncbi:MAG: bifunctional folylpolyglutamate synthase/dihydrofolate synthase, partial [Beijerinckiaceae bacterium]|nr:bifunctional folylpolyglutamate synthase/dihydrofolate synthase [Beijerinckiaceae bacterium]
MATPTSDEMMARFLSLHPRMIDLSLGRMAELLEKLGHPERRLPPVIHVAGTNGKGSTVAFLRAILEAGGRRAHVFTSPHLVRFHERIRLGADGRGKLVGEDALIDAFARCEAANAGAPITVFEIVTAAALLLFSETPADVLLLEVGLGGRFDATNVIADPVASVITPVSFDHPDYLGSTIAEIADAKAGIIKPGAPVIVAQQTPEAMRVIEREALRARTQIILAERDFFVRAENGRLVFEDGAGLLDLPLPRLAGRHQIENAAVAIATLRRVDPALSAQAYEGGMLQAEWPARLQHLTRGRLVERAPAGAEFWLDGAHNEAGARVLADAMGDFEERRPRPLVLVCGSLSSKDTGAFLRAFAGLAQEVIAVPIHGPHGGRSVHEVTELAQAEGLPAASCDSVEQALDFLA